MNNYYYIKAKQEVIENHRMPPLFNLLSSDHKPVFRQVDGILSKDSRFANYYGYGKPYRPEC